MKFCFGIHNHQPVGNFDWVIEKVHRESYRPLLSVLWQKPRVKFSLHVSGNLLDWTERHDPEILRLVRRMAARGQAEIVGGAYYEPILGAIPREDRIGQIRMYRERARRLFGADPRGVWVAERVWEPELAETLAEAGAAYTALDDRMFLVTGFAKSALDRCFVTESGGAYLKVFPIDMKMRFLVPFRPVEEIEAYLRARKAEGAAAAFYFDDGEKFGAWPGTHDWVYGKGWLDRFLGRLEALEREGIETATYSEVLDAVSPGGIAYLPSASYAEMEDWALPAEAFREIRAYRSETRLEEPSPFVRGGIWKHFLVKYPEANRMHKAMLETSRQARAAAPRLGPARRRKLFEALYAAQCNDAYWHGVFGGLYLPHLRQGVWSKLCEAKRILAGRGRVSARLDRVAWDRAQAAFFDSDAVSAVWQIEQGGVLSQFLLLRKGMNLLGTLGRYPEGYHSTLRDQAQKLAREGLLQFAGAGATAPEEPADGMFPYDRYGRVAFLDRFFRAREGAKADFLEGRLEGAVAEDGTARLSGRSLAVRYAEGPFEVSKTVTFLPRSGFRVAYRIRNAGAAPARSAFGTEINFYLPVCQLVEQDGGRLVFRDSNTGTRAVLGASGKPEFWHYPVFTRHLSEAGFNETYQGTCAMPFWQLDLRPGEAFTAEVAFEAQERVDAPRAVRVN